MVEGKNKTGFTLIELLVYMAILGIIVLVVGQVFKDSTKIRVRTQSMLKATEIAGAAASVLKTDVAQMGAKSSQEDVETFEVHNEVYIDPDNTDADLVDKSSFVLDRTTEGGKSKDRLFFKKVRYDDDGTYLGVESVDWYVDDNKNLVRECKQVALKSEDSKNEDCPEDGLTVIIAENVDEFAVIPAKPGVQEDGTEHLLFPSSIDPTHFRLIPRSEGPTYVGATASPLDGGVELRGLSTNYDDEADPTEDPYAKNCAGRGGCKVNQFYAAPDNGTVGSWSDLCSRIDLDAEVEYQISFSMPRGDNMAQNFLPGKDHMSIGLRTRKGELIPGIEDFIFYPPTGDKANTVKRYMRFNVSEPVEDACLALTLVSFSPLVASGSITIKSLKLSRLSEPNYDFSNNSYNPAVKDKAHIRAFRFDVSIKKNNESGKVSQIVPVPSNGVSSN